MSRTLVYVDKNLIVGIAIPFIGSEVHVTRQKSALGGFNWLVQGEISRTTQEGVITQTRDLPPEVLVTKLLNCFPQEWQFDTIDSCTKILKEREADNNIGKVIMVNGILKVKGLNSNEEYDPFGPIRESVERIIYNGRTCFMGELTGDGIRLPVYFDESAIPMASYCNGKMVEVLGMLNFAPWYNAGKDRTLNLILNGVALWVK